MMIVMDVAKSETRPKCRQCQSLYVISDTNNKMTWVADKYDKCIHIPYYLSIIAGNKGCRMCKNSYWN